MVGHRRLRRCIVDTVNQPTESHPKAMRSGARYCWFGWASEATRRHYATRRRNFCNMLRADSYDAEHAVTAAWRILCRSPKPETLIREPCLPWAWIAA